MLVRIRTARLFAEARQALRYRVIPYKEAPLLADHRQDLIQEVAEGCDRYSCPALSFARIEESMAEGMGYVDNHCTNHVPDINPSRAFD